jgi:hypothetical protein
MEEGLSYLKETFVVRATFKGTEDSRKERVSLFLV